jgi:hypothetical protein
MKNEITKITFFGQTKNATRTGSLANVSGLTHYTAYFPNGTVEYYLKGQKNNVKLFVDTKPATEDQKRNFSYC